MSQQDLNVIARLGVCQAFDAMSNEDSAVLDEAAARLAVEFVLEYGTRDPDVSVREAFLACGVKVCDLFCRVHYLLFVVLRPRGCTANLALFGKNM